MAASVIIFRVPVISSSHSHLLNSGRIVYEVSEHLTTQQLEGYRRRTLEPAELLALGDHLMLCAACRRQLREAIPARETILALQTNLRNAASTPPVFWSWMVDLFSPQSWTLPLVLRAAGIAATAALLILALTLWLWGRSERRDEIVIAPSPTAPSPTPPIYPSPPPEVAAPILLALIDGGGQVTLDTQGKLSGLESLSPADQQRVKTALTTRKVETPRTLRELKSALGTVMGSPTGDSFALLNPIGQILASNRPTLRWRPLRGAMNYQVTITDPQANYKEVAVSPALSGEAWQVDRPLKRGRVYAWQVTARTESGEAKAPALNAPEAKFRVLEQTKADELARAEKAFAGNHLTLGLLYALAGLLDEAEREFQALVKANPESDVAKSLLRDIRAKRRAR